jgi:hypothetical protein
MLTADELLLVSVTVFAPPVLPNVTVPQVSEVGDAATGPAVLVVPVPERDVDSDVDPAVIVQVAE